MGAMVDNDAPSASLGFREEAVVFESASQNARVWTEGWVEQAMFCSNCGAQPITRFTRNKPVADFFCDTCAEEYELKSQKGRFGRKVVDGAYATMTARLASANNPNLLLLNYDLRHLSVTDLIVVPKHFFTPDVIEKRKPLAPTARRAGWVGCNILLAELPEAGKIRVIRDGILTGKTDVMAKWQETLFLREVSISVRGWLIEVLKCVERIGSPTFSLDDVYGYETHLRGLYPDNQNVRPKIRQQLQVLRDRGLLEFVGRGHYRLRAVH